MKHDESDINNEILEKIDESNAPDNVKEFIREALQFEYDNSSKTKPQFRDVYKNMINKYK